jgi:hypothetical protein
MVVTRDVTRGSDVPGRDLTRVPGTRDYATFLPLGAMKILLLRPVPGNERFGLGPFLRIEHYLHEYSLAPAAFSVPIDQKRAG